MKNYPITFGAPTDSEDKFADINFVKCTCGVIQLLNLIDPNILYENSHNNTFNTPTWKAHHIEFSNFIKKYSTNKTLLEFGGYSGILAKLLVDWSDKYSIVDLCDKNPNIENVEFFVGNCETYRTPSNSTIIMSHLFEHLYNSRLFLENVKETNEIFISIPNMNIALDNKNMSFINNEHTYFINDSIIRYLFAEFSYECVNFYEFKTHSLFYHFKHSNNIKQVIIEPRTDELINYFLKRELQFKNIQLHNNIFIVPGGHLGQIMYYFLKDKKENTNQSAELRHAVPSNSSILESDSVSVPNTDTNILGFLDNDITKQNLRTYGTPLLTYSLDKVKEYSELSVLLISSPYQDELKKQLLELNSNIKFISLEV